MKSSIKHLLLNAGLIEERNDVIIYTHQFLDVLDIFLLYLNERLSKLGFKRNLAIDKNSFITVVNINDELPCLRYYVNSPFNERLIDINGLFINKIEAREQLFNLIEVFTDLFREIFCIATNSFRLLSDNEEEYRLISILDGNVKELLYANSSVISISNTNYNHVNAYLNIEVFLELIVEHKDINNQHFLFVPLLAPYQVMIIPNKPEKVGIMKTSKDVHKMLESNKTRVKLLQNINNANLGIPLTIKVISKELKVNHVMMKNNYIDQQESISIDNCVDDVNQELFKIQHLIYKNHFKSLLANTKNIKSIGEFKLAINDNKKLIKTTWCGCNDCLKKIEELTSYQAKFIPFNQETNNGECIFCHNKANKIIIFTPKQLIRSL
jgi:hypothetical protein